MKISPPQLLIDSLPALIHPSVRATATTCAADSGCRPVSMLKIWAIETYQRIGLAIARDARIGEWETHMHLLAPLFNISAAKNDGGSNEVQRNILGRTVLKRLARSGLVAHGGRRFCAQFVARRLDGALHGAQADLDAELGRPILTQDVDVATMAPQPLGKDRMCCSGAQTRVITSMHWCHPEGATAYGLLGSIDSIP